MNRSATPRGIESAKASSIESVGAVEESSLEVVFLVPLLPEPQPCPVVDLQQVRRLRSLCRGQGVSLQAIVEAATR